MSESTQVQSSESATPIFRAPKKKMTFVPVGARFDGNDIVMTMKCKTTAMGSEHEIRVPAVHARQLCDPDLISEAMKREINRIAREARYIDAIWTRAQGREWRSTD